MNNILHAHSRNYPSLKPTLHIFEDNNSQHVGTVQVYYENWLGGLKAGHEIEGRYLIIMHKSNIQSSFLSDCICDHANNYYLISLIPSSLKKMSWQSLVQKKKMIDRNGCLRCSFMLGRTEANFILVHVGLFLPYHSRREGVHVLNLLLSLSFVSISKGVDCLTSRDLDHLIQLHMGKILWQISRLPFYFGKNFSFTG